MLRYALIYYILCRHELQLSKQRLSSQQELAAMLVQQRCSAASTFQEEASTSSSGYQQQNGKEQRPFRQGKLQTYDFSVMAACVAEMRQQWVPAKVDQVSDAGCNESILASAKASPEMTRP